MLNNLRRKRVQKIDIKSYGEKNTFWHDHVLMWGSSYSSLGNQRYSKKKIDKPFEQRNPRLIPYYKVGNEIYNMIFCPSGSFWKGGAYYLIEREKCSIKKPFLLGETEITQALYEKIMGKEKNISHFKDSPMLPIDHVSWYDAIFFCNALSKECGLSPYYEIVETIEKAFPYPFNRLPPRIELHYKIKFDESSKGFRLPTSIEWEYAAKAGTENRWAGTNDLSEIKHYIWYSKSLKTGKRSTREVKKKLPNEWGFYDMGGNVSEWCENEAEPMKDDTDIANVRYVIKGGDWSYSHEGMLCVYWQAQSTPLINEHHYGIGFRICRYV